MMSRPDGWVSWKEAGVEHGLTYKVSELQISKDNRYGSNEVLCFVRLDKDQLRDMAHSAMTRGQGTCKAESI